MRPSALIQTAPVIPKPETTEPLSAEVASPATVPTETTEATPAVNGEKKDTPKADKRKSTFPFAFGKKSEAPASPDAETSADAEKKGPNAFSKLRATIKVRAFTIDQSKSHMLTNSQGKGKAAEKPADKAEEKPAEATAETPKIEEETTATEEAKPAVETKPAEEAVAAPTEETAKDAPVASTPTVTATA